MIYSYLYNSTRIFLETASIYWGVYMIMKYTRKKLAKLKRKRREARAAHRKLKSEENVDENILLAAKTKRRKRKHEYYQYKRKLNEAEHLLRCINIVKATVENQEETEKKAIRDFSDTILNMAIATGHDNESMLIVNALESYLLSMPSMYNDQVEELNSLKFLVQRYNSAKHCISANKHNLAEWQEELENM